MTNIQAIGFDLFNTLIIADRNILDDAIERLTRSLQGSGLALDDDEFKKVHRDAAVTFIKETRHDGRETHNRLWISAALQSLGHDVHPDDARIAVAVEDYFSAFYEHCRLIPGTLELLENLKKRFRLGLLSNFTHAPAASEIIDRLALAPLFDVVLISGDLGYRKPHPTVFRSLLEALEVSQRQLLFVGDDLEADIAGAQDAGIQPVWTTYVRDHNVTFAPPMGMTEGKAPGADVARISEWRDLTALLDGE
jgi:HAD superfamily hydrolase (TIGR01549 family)